MKIFRKSGQFVGIITVAGASEIKELGVVECVTPTGGVFFMTREQLKLAKAAAENLESLARTELDPETLEPIA